MKEHSYFRIEFMGLPSAGKTSLCRGVARLFKGNNFVFTTDQALNLSIKRRNSGRLKNLFKRLPEPLREPIIGTTMALPEFHIFMSEHIGLWHQVLEVLEREDCSIEKCRLITYSFLQQGVQYQLLKQYMHQSEYVLIEEGFGQRGFTLFSYLSKKDQMTADEERYVANIPLPDMLIWIMIDADNAVYRISKRAEPPVLLKGMTDDVMNSQLSWGGKVLEKIADFIERRGVRTLRVSNNDGEYDNAFAFIAKEVKSVISHNIEL
jgi:hypothetical protein